MGWVKLGFCCWPRVLPHGRGRIPELRLSPAYLGSPSEGSGATGATSFDSQHHRVLGIAWGARFAALGAFCLPQGWEFPKGRATIPTSRVLFLRPLKAWARWAWLAQTWQRCRTDQIAQWPWIQKAGVAEKSLKAFRIFPPGDPVPFSK